MKKIFYILALILLAACSKPTARETPLYQVMSEIEAEVTVLQCVDEDLSNQKNAEKYGISSASIKDGIACYSTAEGISDKIILVRANKHEDIENIEKALSSQLTASAAAWNNNETESKKIEKALLKTKDDCVILAISDEIDKIERIFDKNI